jgi:choline dehydrogenase
MRRYFQRLEHWAGHGAPQITGASSNENSALHGYNGWLHVSLADPKLVGREPYFLEIINAIHQTCKEKLNIPDNVHLPLDPNDWRVVNNHTEGTSFIPLAFDNGVRNGTRERIVNTQKEFPEYLVVQLNSLVTKVLFDDKQAIGVEYMQGKSLFRSSSKVHKHEQSLLNVVFARREVILAGGAFNTPQLLKLSGIGPQAELQKFGIQVVHDAPGVGENLQDRYEVGVVNELINNYSIFNRAKLDVPDSGTQDDPLYAEWQQQHTGPYATNGTLAAIIKRSSVADLDPDLFIFAIPGFFRGYYPSYSAEFSKYQNALTWIVLKAHTNNRAGRVLLRSSDPRDPPIIEFKYFNEGNDRSGNDLEAVVDGVELARDIGSRLKKLVKCEIIPGPNVCTRDEIRTFVRDEAWGHHASCTCKIGASDDSTAVLDSSFRVRGVKNLRVVDASVFPYIPGFFILSAVYMISEKASEILISEHSGG